jgi:hypothetical protein
MIDGGFACMLILIFKRFFLDFVALEDESTLVASIQATGIGLPFQERASAHPSMLAFFYACNSAAHLRVVRSGGWRGAPQGAPFSWR